MLGVFDNNINFHSSTMLSYDYDNMVDYSKEENKTINSFLSNTININFSEFNSVNNTNNLSVIPLAVNLSTLSFSGINQFDKKNENNKYKCFNVNLSESYTYLDYLYYNHSEFENNQKTSTIPNMNNILSNFDFNSTKDAIGSALDVIYVILIIISCFLIFYLMIKCCRPEINVSRRSSERITYTRLTPINNIINNDKNNL